MTILASLSSLLGSLWFAAACALGGYIAGQLFPFSWLLTKIGKR
jgi:hypothetical protein